MSNELSSMIVDAIKQVSGQTVPAVTADQKIASLGLDSVSVMELVGTLEEKLGKQFADEELAKLETFGDLATLIEGKKAA